MAYTQKEHAASRPETDFIEKIKSNHFNLGYEPKGTFVTTF